MRNTSTDDTGEGESSLPNESEILIERKASARALASLASVELSPARLLAGIDSRLRELLLKAADAADAVFWAQMLPREFRDGLFEEATNDPELQELLLFHYGPWDHLNNDRPFYPAPPKAPGATFYPPDLSADEFTKCLEEHPDARASLESPFTVVRRHGEGLVAIPYHDAFRGEVARLRGALEDASRAAAHPGLADYLHTRAHEVTTDDYVAGDTQWVRLVGHPVDLVVGPYEVYEDGLLGLKAAYQAILTLRDEAESKRIQHYESEIAQIAQVLQSMLGVPLEFAGTRIAISISKLVYTGGYARKGTPAIGFTLPNDAGTVEEAGSRQVILSNVLEAKFAATVWPIAERALASRVNDPETASRHFVMHTIFHEISHAVGPRAIEIDGVETSVNRALRQYHSPLEEAKADLLAASMLEQLLDGQEREAFLRTYVVGLLRPLRFGLSSAHGAANAIQFNYLLERGAIRVDRSDKVDLDPRRVPGALRDLLAQIVSTQIVGDFGAARGLVGRYRTIEGPLAALLRDIEAVPIDVRLQFAR